MTQLEERYYETVSFCCLRRDVRVYFKASTTHERIGRIEHDLIRTSEPSSDLNGVSIVMADADGHELDAPITNHTHTQA